MAETQQSSRTETTRSVPSQGSDHKASKHVHHGRTPAAWAGVAIAMVGFLIGGFAIVDHQNWTLFWIGAGLCVVAVIVARVLQVMGYGAD